MTEEQQRQHSFGMVLDIWTEKSNDGVKYSKVAGQAEFDKF